MYLCATLLLMEKTPYTELYKNALQAGEERNYRKAVDLLRCIVSETDELPEALLYLGRGYHALGEFERAVPHLKNFIKLYPNSSSGYFFLGRTFLALKEYYSAVKILKRGLELQPDNVHIRSFIGLAYLKAKQPGPAVQHLAFAVEHNPDNGSIYTGYINALTVRAIQLFHQGDFDLSRQMFEFVLERGNSDIFIHVYLGQIYKETGEYDSAIHHYDEALSQSPEDALLRLKKSEVLLLCGKQKDGMDIIREVKSIFPELSPESINPQELNKLLAIQHFQRKEWKKAIHYGKQVIKLFGRDIDIHLLMGEASRQIGKEEAAYNHFLRALEGDREKLESRYGLVMVLWQTGNYEQLLKELNAIKHIDPQNEIFHYYYPLCLCKLERPVEETVPALQKEIRNTGPDVYLMSYLGMEYIKGGRSDLAEKWFLKCLALEPKHLDGHRGLIRVYTELDRPKEAIEAFNAYLTLNSKDHTKRNEFIHLLVKEQEYEKAVEEILKILPAVKEDSDILRLLAYAYREIGEYREASALYRQLLRNDPKNENYLRSLVYTLEGAGELEEATKILSSALHYITPNASLLLILGVLYYRNNETEASLEAFRRVLTLAPNDWRAYKNIGLVYKKKGIHEMAENFFRKAEKYT